MAPRFRMVVAAAAVLAVVAFPNVSKADPIAITGGFVGMTNGQDLPGFTVTGTGSEFTGILPIAGVLCCAFNPGDLVTLNFSFPVSTLPFQLTTQTVNGVAYPNAFLRGEFQFTSTPFVAPPHGDGSETFRFTTPFNMTGLLSGFSDNTISDTSLLFSVPITGSGIAFVDGDIHPTPTYVGQRVGFEFQAPAATPEPASIVLFGTALVGVLRGAARRKQRPAER